MVHANFPISGTEFTIVIRKTDNLEQLNFCSLKVTDFELGELHNLLQENVTKKEKISIFGYGLGYLAQFKDEPYLYDYINDSDVMLVDGTWFKFILKLFGYKIRCAMSIPEFVMDLIAFANLKGYSIYLLGGKPEVNNKAVQLLRLNYKGLGEINGHHGYFTKEEEESLLSEINGLRPDILLIGMSTPLKEKLAFSWREKVDSRIIIPCGGMIDVLAGVTQITPSFLKRIGLASFYRLIQEPKRLIKREVTWSYEIIFHLIPVLFYYRIKKEPFSIINYYRMRYLKKNVKT